MDLERGKIAEFARAVCSTNAAYLSGERPPVPPTFLTTAVFWEGEHGNPWEAVQMDQRRGLHAEQEFVFHGPPPRAGTRLSATSRITDIYEKPSRRAGTLTFVVMVTEFVDEEGRLVAESRLTGVETELVPERA